MAEFRLVSPEEPAPGQQRRGWTEWRFTHGQAAAMKAACLSIVPAGKAVQNVLRSIDINTRRQRKAPTPALLDPAWNQFVVLEIRKMERRDLAQAVWATCCARAGRDSGTVQAGVRELARELRADAGHVSAVLGELCRMNALIRREAWPDGPDYVVNAYVLPPGGGLLVQLEQEQHGKPVPYARRAD